MEESLYNTYSTITEKEYNRLITIQKDHPQLTFQNEGYQYIDKSKLSKEDLIAIDEITSILKKAIYGFVTFNNFKVSNTTKELGIRYQYLWSPSFTGVGYLSLIKLKSIQEEVVELGTMEDFNKYLVDVEVRSEEYTHTKEEIANNIEYFRKCFNEGLSAYKALLFLNVKEEEDVTNT